MNFAKMIFCLPECRLISGISAARKLRPDERAPRDSRAARLFLLSKIFPQYARRHLKTRRKYGILKYLKINTMAMIAGRIV